MGARVGLAACVALHERTPALVNVFKVLSQDGAGGRALIDVRGVYVFGFDHADVIDKHRRGAVCRGDLQYRLVSISLHIHQDAYALGERAVFLISPDRVEQGGGGDGVCRCGGAGDRGAERGLALAARVGLLAFQCGVNFNPGTDGVGALVQRTQGLADAGCAGSQACGCEALGGTHHRRIALRAPRCECAGVEAGILDAGAEAPSGVRIGDDGVRCRDCRSGGQCCGRNQHVGRVGLGRQADLAIGDGYVADKLAALVGELIELQGALVGKLGQQRPVLGAAVEAVVVQLALLAVIALGGFAKLHRFAGPRQEVVVALKDLHALLGDDTVLQRCAGDAQIVLKRDGLWRPGLDFLLLEELGRNVVVPNVLQERVVVVLSRPALPLNDVGGAQARIRVPDVALGVLRKTQDFGVPALVVGSTIFFIHGPVGPGVVAHHGAGELGGHGEPIVDEVALHAFTDPARLVVHINVVGGQVVIGCLVKALDSFVLVPGEDIVALVDVIGLLKPVPAVLRRLLDKRVVEGLGFGVGLGVVDVDAEGCPVVLGLLQHGVHVFNAAGAVIPVPAEVGVGRVMALRGETLE